MNSQLEKIYFEENDIWGLPQEYKKLKIYPIKLCDVYYKKLFYKLLTTPKSYIADRDILKSSYLKFIIYVIYPSLNLDNQKAISDICDFLRYVTKAKEVALSYRETGREGFEAVEIRIHIDNLIFTEMDFDNFREIILEQSGLSIEYIEDYNPELEVSLNFVNRNSQDIDFMDEVFTLAAIMKISIKDLADYSLFQFQVLWEKVLTLKEYDIYKPLLASGSIELKTGELKSYIFHSHKSGRYDSIKIDADAFKKKTEEAFATS
jgi:hypothetical protein